MVTDCNRPKCHFIAISLASQLQSQRVKALQGRVVGLFFIIFFAGVAGAGAGGGDDFRFSAPS